VPINGSKHCELCSDQSKSEDCQKCHLSDYIAISESGVPVDAVNVALMNGASEYYNGIPDKAQDGIDENDYNDG
jgi:hypothetical protein